MQNNRQCAGPCQTDKNGAGQKKHYTKHQPVSVPTVGTGCCDTKHVVTKRWGTFLDNTRYTKIKGSFWCNTPRPMPRLLLHWWVPLRPATGTVPVVMPSMGLAKKVFRWSCRFGGVGFFLKSLQTFFLKTNQSSFVLVRNKHEQTQVNGLLMAMDPQQTQLRSVDRQAPHCRPPPILPTGWPPTNSTSNPRFFSCSKYRKKQY